MLAALAAGGFDVQDVREKKGWGCHRIEICGGDGDAEIFSLIKST